MKMLDIQARVDLVYVSSACKSISDNSEQTDTLRKQLSEIAKDYLMMLDFRVFGKTLKPSSEAINISKPKT